MRGDYVTVIIDNKSGAPIYDQIYSQIKNQIISGELKENEIDIQNANLIVERVACRNFR